MFKHITIFFAGLVIIIILLSCGKEKHDFKAYGKIYLSEVDNEIMEYDIGYNKFKTIQVFKNDSTSLNQVLSISSSSKGEKIVFAVDNHKNMQIYNLLCMDLKSGSIDTLVYNTNQEIDYPSFSPNDNFIAMLVVGEPKVKHYWFLPKNIGFDELPDARLMIISLKTKTNTVISTPPLALSKPSWSMDGKSLWASTYDGTILQIWLDGSINNTGSKGYCPTISPNGKLLAYLKGRSLYVKDLASNRVKKVASRFSKYMPREYNMLYITWSPDSKYILYQGEDFLSYITHWRSQYVIVPIENGGTPFLVKDVVAGGFSPAWVP